ncbi:MAG: hypothetical protein WC146_00570 [Patescibacteria group bacterium]|jgi:tetratricopeptide (TPR) repeat protein
MLIVISLILIGISLVVILIIVLKKFPVLAILNVTNIPGEKEAKFKRQIIENRVDRDLARWSGFIGRFWLRFYRLSAGLLRSWQEKLRKAKMDYRTGAKMSWPEKQRRITELLLSAEELSKKEAFNEAEEKLLEVIGLDQKNLSAFFELGGLYAVQKKWPEARETYEYALKLARQFRNDKDILGDLTVQEISFSLAEVEAEAGDSDEALENVREALDLEPNNPRYLDLILDLSIMKKDKVSANDAWEKLNEVNPENQKLVEWREEIERIE